MLNAYWEPLQFELPRSDATWRGSWRRLLDTSLPSPHDVCSWYEAQEITAAACTVQPRSIAVLAQLAAAGR
jgi:glycogen operon protein